GSERHLDAEPGRDFRDDERPSQSRRPAQTPLPDDHPRLRHEKRPAGVSFGVMGGTMQPQGHAQVMVRIADYGQNPQAASDGPRYRIVQGLEVSVESGFAPAVLDDLARRGHKIVSVPDDYNQFGCAQFIWKLDGGYFAPSDPCH